MTKMTQVGPVILMMFTYEHDRSDDRATKGLTTSTKLCLHFYHSMFILHDEWQDFIAQTSTAKSEVLQNTPSWGTMLSWSFKKTKGCF